MTTAKIQIITPYVATNSGSKERTKFYKDNVLQLYKNKKLKEPKILEEYKDNFLNKIVSDFEIYLGDTGVDDSKDYAVASLKGFLRQAYPDWERLPSNAVLVEDTKITSHAAATPPLPEKALKLWAKDRLPDDAPPDFIKRHYGEWIGNGLTRPLLGRLDNALNVALSRWLKKSNTLDFDLPTRSDLIEREAAHEDPEAMKKAWRLASRYDRSRNRSL